MDRLWPRGVRKEDARPDRWAKEVAPGDGLRRWFGHRTERWAEFRRRYFAELDEEPEVWQPLLQGVKEGRITLVYAAQDREHNNAAALKE